jgi:hypothetical protein
VTRRRVALAAGATLATLTLSACAPTLLGSAAVVDGERISISEIEGAIDRVRDLQMSYGAPGELGPLAAHDEVHRRVIDAVFAKAGRDLGIEVTDGEVAAMEARERANAGSEDAYIQIVALQNNITVEEIPNLFRRTILTQKIQDKLVADAGGNLSEAEARRRLTEHLIATAKSMQIRINPRYGRFEPTAGQIVPVTPDYFRQPAAPPGRPLPDQPLPDQPLPDEPTQEPTAGPTDEPTAGPTDEPTDEPTDVPTGEPTGEPSGEPTEQP